MHGDPRYNEKRCLFSRFLKEENYNYGKEAFIFKRVFQLAPDWQFWRELELDFDLNSMAFFLTKNGRELLAKKYNRYNFSSEIKNETPEVIEPSQLEMSELFKNRKPAKRTIMSILQ